MSIEPTVSASRVPARFARLTAPILALALAACGPGTTDVGSTESPPTATTTAEIATPLPSPSNAEPEAPTWVSDIAGQLECAGPVPLLGGEVGELFPERFSGETAEAALSTFLGPSNPFASLPTAGYVVLHDEDHWVSFAHVFAGPKAIIVLNDETEFGPGWAVVGLRACDASEFDPSVALTFPVTIWTDVNGTPVSTELVHSNPGPEHCGWHLAIFLRVGDALFFRDPEGVVADYTDSTFEVGATVPPTAADTGYRSNDYQLWVDPGGDAYLVAVDPTVNPTERWPRAIDDFGCA